MFFILALLGVPVLVVLLVVAARTRGRIRAVALGLVLLWFPAERLCFWINDRQLHYWDGIDLNPNVVPAQLVGHWRSRWDGELVLLGDGGYQRPDSGVGGWAHASGRSTEFHVGALRLEAVGSDAGVLLIPVEPDSMDPDEWTLPRAFWRENDDGGS